MPARHKGNKHSPKKNQLKNNSSQPVKPDNKPKQMPQSEHSYSIVDENSCSVCETKLADDDAAIQCEVCEFWYCVNCSGMSRNFYEELGNSDLRENFMWYCNGCKKAIPGVRQVLKMVSSIKESYDEMNNRLDRLESKITEADTELSQDHRIDQALYDFKEREMRKNNLIIYNLPESNAANGEDRKVEESEKVEKICESLEMPSTQENVVRLGERKTGDGARPRPLKVTFLDENSKKKFLKSSSLLKNTNEFKKISVTPDYTFRQRKINNQMKAEVAKRRQTDPSFNYRKLKDELAGVKPTVETLSSDIDLSQVPRTSPMTDNSRIPRFSSSQTSGIPRLSSSQPYNQRVINASQRNVKATLLNSSKNGGAEGHGLPLGRGSGAPGGRR